MKTIPDYPNYAITQSGKVWVKIRYDGQGRKAGGKWLRPAPCKRGNYPVVTLSKNNNKRTFCIHTLVLEAYIGKRPVGKECRHLDGNPQNNNLDNLCWGTHSENMLDRALHGTSNRGERQGRSKLTERDVRLIIYINKTKLFLQNDIGILFGVGLSSISSIVRKKIWKHIWR